MNPWRVAEEFRLLAEVDPAFADVACANEQGDSQVAFPRMVFGARVRMLKGSSQIGIAELTISVESHSQDASVGTTSPELHEALVKKVSKKFFGDNDATAKDVRAAIAATISAAGRLNVDPRYLPIAADPGIEGHRFKTPLALKAGVCFPPAV